MNAGGALCSLLGLVVLTLIYLLRKQSRASLAHADAPEIEDPWFQGTLRLRLASLARALNGTAHGPAPGPGVEFLSGAEAPPDLQAGLVDGGARTSAVGGHVFWRRNGHAFYCHEIIVQGEHTTVVAARLPRAELPRFQIHFKRDPRAGHRLPDVCPQDPEVPHFADLCEVRVPEAARPVALPAAMRAEFLRLNRTLPLFPALETQPAWCRVHLPLDLRMSGFTPARLEAACRLIDTVIAAFGPGAPDADATLVDVLSVTAAGQVVCQVCGEPIACAPAVCASCTTPHHPECWNYAGVCSTYGCGSKQKR